MNSAVSPEKVDSVPSSAAALSIKRSEVEPTATMRPPARRAQSDGRLGADAAPLGVHFVVIRVVGLDRKKRAGADMQRHAMQADAVFAQCFDHRLRKEEAPRRGRPPT